VSGDLGIWKVPTTERSQGGSWDLYFTLDRQISELCHAERSEASLHWMDRFPGFVMQSAAKHLYIV